MRVNSTISRAKFLHHKNKLSNIKNIYDSKTIKYGSYIDYYSYQKPQYSFRATGRDYQKASKGSKQDFSLSRARESIYRLAECNIRKHGNYKPVFFTLTSADQVTDRKESNKKIKSFVRRMNVFLGFKLKYLIVPELHKSGAIHYHGLFFNMPFIPIKFLRTNLWKFGYVDLQIPKNIKYPARYIAKYLSKDYINEAPLHTKMYFGSRGLVYPQVSFEKEELPDNIRLVEVYSYNNVIKRIYRIWHKKLSLEMQLRARQREVLSTVSLNYPMDFRRLLLPTPRTSILVPIKKETSFE